MRRASVALAAVLLGPVSAAGSPTGRLSPAQLIKRIGFAQRPGARLPLDVPFTASDGRTVTLRGLLAGKPAILAPVYYECPMLCTLTLNGLVRCLRVLSLLPGRDFQVIAFSINPLETPGLARAKKETYLAIYRRPGTEGGWHFLVGRQASIDALAGAAGFKYVYDPASKQYAHAPGLIFVTPAGVVSRYMPGVEFDPEAVRLSIIDASAGRLGTIVDKAFLLCYCYDPATGRYNFVIMRALRILGILTIAGLAGGVAWLLRGERAA